MNCENDRRFKMNCENEQIKSLEQFGVYTKWDLLEIVEKADIPDFWLFGESSSIVHEVDGWKIKVFYYCEELEYIENITTPNGVVLDFWEWGSENEWRDVLIVWRGNGDLDTMKKRGM